MTAPIVPIRILRWFASSPSRILRTNEHFPAKGSFTIKFCPNEASVAVNAVWHNWARRLHLRECRSARKRPQPRGARGAGFGITRSSPRMPLTAICVRKMGRKPGRRSSEAPLAITGSALTRPYAGLAHRLAKHFGVPDTDVKSRPTSKILARNDET